MDHQPAAASVSRPLIGLFQSPDTHTAEYRKRIGALYEAKRVRLVEVEAAVAAARDAEERAKQVCGAFALSGPPLCDQVKTIHESNVLLLLQARNTAGIGNL